MTANPIRTEVYDFLSRYFPGSTLDDGYFFVRIEAPSTHRVRREMAQVVLDRLCDGPSWMVTVNLDPNTAVSPVRLEQTTVAYSPDWTASEEIPQWFAELPLRARVDLAQLRGRLKPLGALAFISVQHRLVFDVQYMRLHAASVADLDRFLRPGDDLFVTDDDGAK